MRPEWPNLADPASLDSWVARMGWVDPLTLCRKTVLPFTERTDALYFIFAPLSWLTLAALILTAGMILDRLRVWIRSAGSRPDGARAQEHSEGRLWLLVGILLLTGGLAGPDSLGPGHGEYLP